MRVTILVVLYCTTNHSRVQWLKTRVIYYLSLVLWRSGIQEKLSWVILARGLPWGCTKRSAWLELNQDSFPRWLTLMASKFVQTAVSLWEPLHGASEEVIQKAEAPVPLRIHSVTSAISYWWQRLVLFDGGWGALNTKRQELVEAIMEADCPFTYPASWQCPFSDNTTNFCLCVLYPHHERKLICPNTIDGTNWAKCNYSPFVSDCIRIPSLNQLVHGILPALSIIQG